MSAKHHPPLTLLALALAAGAAMAETGPYYIGGQLGYTHQSNVLGLADGQDVPGSYKSRSDNVTSLSLVGGLDQRIGRQRLFGDLTVSNNRYADNTVLNNTSYAAKAGVDWETVGNLSGNFTLQGTRDLFSYTPFDQPSAAAQANLVSSRQADFVARLGGVTVVTFEAGAGYRSTDYSDAAFDDRNMRQHYWMAGGSYRLAPNTSVGLRYRDTSGRQPEFGVSGDRMDRQDLDLIGKLELSGLSSLYLRLSRTKIDYDVQQDFSGWTGQLRGTWLPTGKLRLTGEVARDRGQDLRFTDIQFVDGSLKLIDAETSRLVTSWRATAAYELTSKVALNANFGYTRQPISFTSNGAPADGKFGTRTYGIGATWAPTRTSSVGCNLSRLRRSTDVVANRNQSSNSLGCYGQLTLQP